MKQSVWVRLGTFLPNKKFQLNQPMLVASYVEQVWHDRANWDEIELIKSGEKTRNGKTAHLSNALWIMCGARGLKVKLFIFILKVLFVYGHFLFYALFSKLRLVGNMDSS